MTQGPKYSTAEKRGLQTLPVQIPDFDGLSHPFSRGENISKYKVEELGHQIQTRTPRTEIFIKVLKKIWLKNGRQPVPYAFKTQDGTIRSLDAGCLSYFINETKELRVILDDSGYIAEVELVAAADVDDALGFDPRKPVDRRRKAESLRVIRDGARAFRKEILQNWGYSCAVTCVKVVSVLEAAHIFPYGGDNTNNPRNGILLRADLHKLFDKYLLSLSYDGDALVFHVSNRLSQSPYWQLNGRRIGKDKLPDRQPDPKVVSYHYNLFCKAQNSN